MDKHITNTTEASSEEVLYNDIESNFVSLATINTDLNEKSFYAIINNIKAENVSLVHNELSDSEDFTSITCKSIGYQNKEQDKMCDTASTSYEKDVNVSESNLLELTDTKLVDVEPSLCEEICQSANPEFDLAEVDENGSEIIGSHQVVSGHNDIENNQSKLSSRAICSIVQDRSSMDLKESNQCMNEINTIHKTVYLNETDNSTYSFIAAVEPPNSIKRKQSNVICHTISNKGVKKRRLNENVGSYEDTTTTDNNITKYYRNKNIAHPLQFKRTLKKIPIFHNEEKSSKKKCRKNVLFDKCISDSNRSSDSIILSDSSLSDTIILSDSSLSDSEIIVCDTNTLLDSETFSETDSDEIFSDRSEIEETDHVVVVSSDDDLSLDSNCKFVKSELEINPDREIEMGCKFVADSEKSLDDKIILNSHNNNNNINSVKDSDCEIVSDAETDYVVVVSSDDDLSLDSNCKFVKSELEINPDREIEMGCKFVAEWEKSLDEKIILNGHNNNNILNSVKDSDCEIVSDAETDYVVVVSSDDDLSLDSNCKFVKSELEINPDREIEMGCKFVADSEKSLDDKIILNGHNNNNILNSVKDSDCEIVSDAETEISVTEEELNNKKLSTFKNVCNVQHRSDCEMLLDGDKFSNIASWSEKGTIKYMIISDDEIKPSGNKGSTCIIISDNDEELSNKVISTYKINVLKGSDTKISLDGGKVEILSKSENRMETYEIDPSDNKKSNKCIIIFDNEKEFINKTLSTFKIVSNVKKETDCEMLLDGEKVYGIEYDKNIKYIIVSKDEMKSSANKGSQRTILSNNVNKFNHKKSTFNILVKNAQQISHSAVLNDEKSREMSENEEEYNYKKVSDVKITPDGKTIVYDSLGLQTDDNNTINNDTQLYFKHKKKHQFPCLKMTVDEDDDAKDTIQEYFKEYFSAIKYYLQNTEIQSLKELYSQIGNDGDFLMYMMEIFRMFYNGELVVSETADEFSKVYLKEQLTTLYNYYGDPKDSVNASKPFIHSSSHLHQYTKQLSSNIEPLTIKDITTTTSTSTRINTIASPKNNVALNKCVGSKFNDIKTSKLFPLYNSVESRLIRYLPDQTFTPVNQTEICNFQFPVAIKKKTVSKSKVLLPQICIPKK